MNVDILSVVELLLRTLSTVALKIFEIPFSLIGRIETDAFVGHRGSLTSQGSCLTKSGT